MNKIIAIIERASDGTYAAYTNESFDDFELAGYGDTPKDAKEDFLASIEEMKELGCNVPEFEINFQYDTASFLQEFRKELSLSGLEVVTGINQKQLQHYLSGHRKPSESTRNKIKEGVKNFATRLMELELA